MYNGMTFIKAFRFTVQEIIFGYYNRLHGAFGVQSYVEGSLFEWQQLLALTPWAFRKYQQFRIPFIDGFWFLIQCFYWASTILPIDVEGAPEVGGQSKDGYVEHFDFWYYGSAANYGPQVGGNWKEEMTFLLNSERFYQPV